MATTLEYRGTEPYRDRRFIAQPGDRVEFADEEARDKLEREKDLWAELPSKKKKEAGK